MTQQKKSALGRGLGALLSGSESITASTADISGALPAGAVASIPVEKIETNPFQPRTDFDETALRELAESIRQQGIIQPITVRKLGHDRYQIISGERRYRASKLAGLEAIPAYIRIANDQSMLEMALVENIQRENLNPIEIAISYKRLTDECNLSQDQLADKVGKDRSTVTNYMRLLRLPPKIQAAIRDGIISMGHARAMINVDDIGLQLRIFDDILAKNLSVRKVEDLVRSSSGQRKKKKAAPDQVAKQIEYRALQDRLSRFYETKVDLKQGAKGSGKIILSYYSTDDLNRLLDMLEG